MLIKPIAYVLALLVLTLPNASAQTTPDTQAGEIQAALNSQLKDEVLTLRVFYPDKELQFTPDGQYRGENEQGSWTLWSKIKVDAIEVTTRRLAITGKRVNVAYDTKHRRFTNLVSKDDVSVLIYFEGAPVTSESTRLALESVALKKDEHLSDIVPTEWRSVLQAEESHQPIPLVDAKAGKVISRVAQGISAPQVMSAPDPEYGKEARKAKRKGTVVLWTVVDKDGRVSEVRIVKPLGMGLDEKAVEAVRKWRFEPAKRDGVPVPVQINIEVNFRLW